MSTTHLYINCSFVFLKRIQRFTAKRWQLLSERMTTALSCLAPYSPSCSVMVTLCSTILHLCRVQVSVGTDVSLLKSTLHWQDSCSFFTHSLWEERSMTSTSPRDIEELIVFLAQTPRIPYCLRSNLYH